jgi:predicted DNA-binding transcriptional regulator YafY
LIAKISAAVPERLRPFIVEPASGAVPSRTALPSGLDLALTRLWIRAGKKIAIRYRDDKGKQSERTIWPTIIGYADSVRLLAAWCELRQGFRHFRADRVTAAEFLD